MTTEQKSRKATASRAFYAANSEKVRESVRKWQEANPETVRENQRKYRATHPEKVREVIRNWRLKHFYGITPGAYAALVDAQQGKCAICSCPVDRPVVDHDHITGKIRGLLCDAHNKGLGFFQDNPEFLMNAAAYVIKHKQL